MAQCLVSHLRHSKFVTLREDKRAEEVRREGYSQISMVVFQFDSAGRRGTASCLHRDPFHPFHLIAITTDCQDYQAKTNLGNKLSGVYLKD